MIYHSAFLVNPYSASHPLTKTRSLPMSYTSGHTQLGRHRFHPNTQHNRLSGISPLIPPNTFSSRTRPITMGMLDSFNGFPNPFDSGEKKLGCEAPAHLVQERIDSLNELAHLPLSDRFKRLERLPEECRRALLESGPTGDAVVAKLIEMYNWNEFQLDRPGIAGVYPYALLCKMVYMSENAKGGQPPCFDASFQTMMDAGFTVSAVHEKTVEKDPVSNRALIFSRGNEVVIVLRGTQGQSDLCTNLQAVAKPRAEGLSGYFHNGYYRLTEALWPSIEAHIDELQRKTDQTLSIGVVGHSMGSPMATLISERIEQKTECSIEKVVTVGGVKAYNQEAFEQYNELGLNKKTTRVINYLDSITLLWPHFLHPESDRLFFTKQGKYWYNPNTIDVLSNQLQRFTPDDDLGEFKRRTISDHDLDDYIKILYVHAQDEFGPEKADHKGW